MYTSAMSDFGDVSPMFRALGDPTRLKIFNFLRDRCEAVALDDHGDVHWYNGATVGEVCCHITGIDKANSNISFHLKELRVAGLVLVERRGKHSICSINLANMRRLECYFSSGQMAADRRC